MIETTDPTKAGSQLYKMFPLYFQKVISNTLFKALWSILNLLRNLMNRGNRKFRTGLQFISTM
jgi:hypothetical protein